MKLLLGNLPSGLRDQTDALSKCLRAMDTAAKVQAMYLFGTYARGDATSDSEVDLCIVAEDAERQLETAARLREAIWDVWPRPAFTLVPITPERLAEKKRQHDHFFRTVLTEGILLAEKD